jgi:rubrerythrin
MNRTGIGASPQDAKKMAESASETMPSRPGDKNSFAQYRAQSFLNSEPVGTVPPPASAKGVATPAVETVKGKRPTAFIDKIAERLAFERSGTRLYETLLVKFDTKGAFDGGPTRRELEHFHAEESQHFAMLKGCMEELGADPTAMTPSADLASVQSSGVMQVVNDPRTDLGECLEAILTAELVDNDGWSLLTTLAEQVGQTEIAEQFRTAKEAEDEHLASVRKWVEAYHSIAVAREL